MIKLKFDVTRIFLVRVKAPPKKVSKPRVGWTFPTRKKKKKSVGS